MCMSPEDINEHLRRGCGNGQEICDLLNTQDRLKEQIDLEPVFRHPCNMIVVGNSGSGKTYFVSKLIQSGQIRPAPDSIHMFTGVKDASGHLLEALEYLQETQDIPFQEHGDDLERLDEVLDEEGQKLIIIDDLMQKVVNTPKAVELFASGTHHKNASAIMMWQDLFPQGMKKLSITLARNAHYHVIFYSPNVSAFKTFASQRDNGSQLMALYKDSKNYQQTPLVIDSCKNRAWIGLEPTHIVQL